MVVVPPCLLPLIVRIPCHPPLLVVALVQSASVLVHHTVGTDHCVAPHSRHHLRQLSWVLHSASPYGFFMSTVAIAKAVCCTIFELRTFVWVSVCTLLLYCCRSI